MNLTAALLADADRCVMCGLCLPHCPTFRLTRHEAESPRGRIMLMQALARGQLEADSALVGHLDNCLACRACERMCPSLVPYGQLIQHSRALLTARQAHTTPPVLRRLLDAVTDPVALQGKAQALRLYQKSGAQWLARSSGLLKGLGLDGLEQQLPEIPEFTPLAPHYPPHGAKRGTVALFTGCIGALLDQPALHAAVRLLTLLGYQVDVPPTQQCCGSLHLYQGEADTAERLAGANLAAFADSRYEAILVTASGCGAHLSDYGRLYGAAGEAVAERTCDIDTFLADAPWPEALVPAPLAATVALHTPCTLRNVMRQSSGPDKLLARIPGLRLVALDDGSCCGAAGGYQLSHNDTAAALRAPKVEALLASGAAYLASANFGCAHHIAAGVRQQGGAIEALHPVVLLERQLALAGW